MNQYGSVFIIVRNRRAKDLFDMSALPEGSRIVVDSCALDNYISEQEVDKIYSDTQAKVQVGNG